MFTHKKDGSATKTIFTSNKEDWSNGSVRRENMVLPHITYMKRLSKSASTVKMEVMIKMVSHKLKGEIDSDENAQVELG